MNEYFIELFKYDSYANLKLLELLKNLPLIDENAKSIFAHLLNAKRLWLKRIKQEGYKNIEIWPTLDWDECNFLIRENESSYHNYLADKRDTELKAKIRYQNSKGKTFLTPVRDILMHVLIHGGYHRGQIAKFIKKAGGESINTDYITYVRSFE